MGLNSATQQPATPATAAQNPAANAQLNRLRALATTPYQGNAPGGASAQGAAQLVAALLARRRAQALQNGNPNAGLAVPQPATGPTRLPGATMGAVVPQTGPTPLPQQQPAPAMQPALQQPVGLPAQ